MIRSGIMYFAMLVLAIGILYKMFYIQIALGDEYREIDQERNVRVRTIEAARGNIYSDDGSLLATSFPVFDLYWDSQVCPDSIFERDIDSLAICLSEHFKDKSAQEYKKSFIEAKQKGNRYYRVKFSNIRREKDQISYTDLKKIKSFPIFRMGQNRGGFIVEQKSIRKMPYRLLAHRTIGYEQVIWDDKGNEINKLFVGLEGAYSDELKGVDGQRVEQKLRGGAWRPLTEENQIEPQNGNDIVTTINIGVQDVAESALLKQLDSTKSDHGCAVLMEVKTGQIKAIANLKRRSDGSYGEDMNFAIWESLEPGSTFKLISLIALLEDGSIDTNELVPTGKVRFGSFEMKDSYEYGYGNVSLARAFEVSSNVGIARAVTKVFGNRPQDFVDLIKKMGVGEKLGVEIQGEGQPLIKDYKTQGWSATTLPWMSIGYEVKMTPLQLLTLYNAVANDGKMVKPQFVTHIKQAGRVEEEFETVVLNEKICSQSTIDKVKVCMESVVTHGTARRLSNEVYTIAGKTGTAQIAKGGSGYGNIKGQGRNVEYTASFIGYFPADNPKYTCIIMINNPRERGFYGAEIAAPVFREIANKVYAMEIDIPKNQHDSIRIKNIPLIQAGNQKDIQTVYNYLNYKTFTDNKSSGWVNSGSTIANTVRLKSVGYKKGIVPDLRGMGAKDAVFLVEKHGYVAKISGRGHVVSQSVLPGTELSKGSEINLQLGLKEHSFTKTYIANDSIVSAIVADSIKSIEENYKNQQQ